MSNYCYDQVHRNSCYNEDGCNSCYDKAGLDSCYNKAGRISYYDEARRIGILLRILRSGITWGQDWIWRIFLGQGTIPPSFEPPPPWAKIKFWVWHLQTSLFKIIAKLNTFDRSKELKVLKNLISLKKIGKVLKVLKFFSNLRFKSYFF